MRILWALILLSLPFSAWADMAVPEGRVIVTVGGDLPMGNVAPGNEEDVTFFGFLDLSFAAGVGFDDAMLAALPQGEVTLPTYGPWTNVTFRGPYLTAVLAAAGAEGREATPVALDGYQVDIPWDNAAGLRPILATHAQGRPLALGGIGPTAIIYPAQSDAALQEELDALQVWAVVFIGVE